MGRESRRQLAEREARVRLLRERARGRVEGVDHEAVDAVVGPLPPEQALSEVTSDMVTSDVTEASGHINFFQDAEKGEDKVTTNAEHEGAGRWDSLVEESCRHEAPGTHSLPAQGHC